MPEFTIATTWTHTWVGEPYAHRGFKKLSLGLLPFLDYANENKCFSYNKISLILKYPVSHIFSINTSNMPIY